MAKHIIWSILAVSFAFQAHGAPQVIYGSDDRVEIYETSDAQTERFARSIAASVSTFELKKKSKIYSLKYPMPLYQERNICQGERFSRQPVIAQCTAFLIATNKIATAGHCAGEHFYPCEYTAWVFGVQNSRNKDFDPENIPEKNVYRCKKVIAKHYDRHNFKSRDFAIIELDRPVEGREPLKISSRSRVHSGEPLSTLGFPLGIPMKFSDNAQVFEQENGFVFSHNLDTFMRQSGSPIFDRRGEVVGLVSIGKEDTYNAGEQCLSINRCRQDGTDCDYEKWELSNSLKAEYATNASFLRRYL